ncbi:MAG: TIGR00304 family membrane protein [Thermoplasmatota archaeon]
MRVSRLAAVIFLLISLFSLIFSLISGQADIYLFLIIPVIHIEGFSGIIFIITLFLGLFLLFYSMMANNKRDRVPENYRDKKAFSGADIGGVVFIGPIPIIFAGKGFRKRMPGWSILLLIGMFLFVLLAILSLVLSLFFKP